MIPYCILVIEDDDDRAFMEQLFVDYHRLMYHESSNWFTTNGPQKM